MEKNSEESNEQNMLLQRDIINYIIQNFFYIFLGIGFSMYLIYRLYGNQEIKFRQKVLYIMLPIIIVLIIFMITNSPKPISDYYINVIYGDNPTTFDFKKGSN